MKKVLNITKKLVIALYIAITTIILAIAYTPLANLMAEPLVVAPYEGNTDLIAVLGSGVYPNGALTKNATERVARGVVVYNKIKSVRIFFSGGANIPMSEKLTHTVFSTKAKEPETIMTEAYAMKLLAQDLGVKEGNIGIDNDSHSTYENILGIKKYMETSGLKKCVIVTSTTHAYRSIRTARKAGLDCESAPVIDYTMYRVGPFDRLSLFYETAWEYAGLVIYRIKGYI